MQIDVKGISANYVKSGTGDAVLILPGWGAVSSVYNMLIQQLSENYCVYALDLPGFGITPEPAQPWCVDDYADFVTAFIEAVEIKKVMLVGHSYGGRIIIKLCNRQLNFEISEILFIDSAGIRRQATEKQSAKQKRYKTLKKFFSSKPMSSLFPDAIEKLQKKYGSADYAAASPVMRQTLVKSISEDLTPLLSNIKVKSTLVWGRDDTATPYSDALTFNKEIKNSKLFVIDNAGHFPFIDQPFDFRKIIASQYNLSL